MDRAPLFISAGEESGASPVPSSQALPEVVEKPRRQSGAADNGQWDRADGCGGARYRFTEERWYQRLLHNETGFALQKRLQVAGLTMVVLPAKIA